MLESKTVPEISKVPVTTGAITSSQFLAQTTLSFAQTCTDVDGAGHVLNGEASCPKYRIMMAYSTMMRNVYKLFLTRYKSILTRQSIFDMRLVRTCKYIHLSIARLGTIFIQFKKILLS